MSKQIIKFVLFLVILLIIGLFCYFYYIKPQKEYIKISTQDCINKAMAPINQEVVKNVPNPYITSDSFISMKKTQASKINNCLEKYNTILYSTPEKDLLFLNSNTLLDIQNTKINDYIKKINDKIAADKAEVEGQLKLQKQKQDEAGVRQKQQQDTVNACKSVKLERDKYLDCVKEQSLANPNDTNYIMYLMSPNINQSENICLKKYNYFRFGVDEFTCMMMGTNTY